MGIDVKRFIKECLILLLGILLPVILFHLVCYSFGAFVIGDVSFNPYYWEVPVKIFYFFFGLLSSSGGLLISWLIINK